MTTEDWLTKRIGRFPVLANTLSREGLRYGFSDYALHTAFDNLKLSYIKKSKGSCQVYWWKPLVTSHWIWCSFKPILPKHLEWAVEALERRAYQEQQWFHQKRCPPPQTYIIRKSQIEWTEPSSFARRFQNQWFGKSAESEATWTNEQVRAVLRELAGGS